MHSIGFFGLLVVLISAVIARRGIVDFYNASWTQLQVSGEEPLGRQQHTSVISTDGNKMVIFGGVHSWDTKHYLDDVAVLSLDQLSWDLKEPTGDMPMSRRRHSAVMTAEDDMIVFGGLYQDGLVVKILNELAVYSLSEDKWTLPNPIGDIPEPRQGHVALYVKDRHSMLVFGGQGEKEFFNDIVEYDISHNCWKLVEANGVLPVPQALMTAALAGSTMMVFAGIKGHGGYSYYLNELISYDLESKNWNIEVMYQNSPSPRALHATALLDGNKLVTIGGYDLVYLSETILFDCSAQKYQRVLNEGNVPLGIQSHTLVEAGGHIFLYGGSTGYNEVSSTVYRVTITADPALV